MDNSNVISVGSSLLLIAILIKLVNDPANAYRQLDWKGGQSHSISDKVFGFFWHSNPVRSCAFNGFRAIRILVRDYSGLLADTRGNCLESVFLRACCSNKRLNTEKRNLT